jgi:hypothetical protein
VDHEVRLMLIPPGTSLAFDWPSNAVTKLSEDEDAFKQATTMILTSNGAQTEGGDQTPLYARADNTDLLDDGFPALWRVNSSDHSSVSEQATLDDYVTAYADTYHDPDTKRPFTVRADDPIHPVGSYQVGSTVLLSVHCNRWIPDCSTCVQRITDKAVKGLQVELTVEEYRG